MTRHKNPRYRPRENAYPLTSGPGSGFGKVASPAGPPEVLERPKWPKPWIELPLSRPQAAMLAAAATGTLVMRGGRVSIRGGYASVVTLRALRDRGLVSELGVRLTDSGREAVTFHRLQDDPDAHLA